MAIVDERLSYEFPQWMKDGILLVLSKFPDHYQDISRIRECVRLPGKTVLTSCEAIILAGIVRPYYPPYADRLERHPAIVARIGIPQLDAAA